MFPGSSLAAISSRGTRFSRIARRARIWRSERCRVPRMRGPSSPFSSSSWMKARAAAGSRSAIASPSR
ncbi:MAG: hypothetical protein DMF79_07540 [Acidobacteria bacterium]|nr:MAG: hypothetical protein DMF79_07540 [Acidobacteriota bacterium]